MPYPDEIDKFTEKLNKSDTIYVIEEEVTPVNGKYEGLLAHDNITDSSVHVFTGPKLTGEKIDNFILSIPANTDWKRSIKIFSNAAKLYITYESHGDQVEAGDINALQDSIVATQIEIDGYKAANNLAVNNTIDRVRAVENNKSEKTYVDEELFKKADKVNTYTKTETDSRIQEIVGAAPDALDTLQELGSALNNDPDFAATMTNELSKKVDKVNGKQLSTEDFSTAEKIKLAGVEGNANNYTHPSTHPATMIVEDTAHRFVSDVEKDSWNSKETPQGAQDKVNVHEGKKTNPHGVTKAQVGLANVDNVQQATKTEFNSHNTDSVRHITNAERSSWNAKETPIGAQTKATQAKNDANSYTYEEIGVSGLKQKGDADNDWNTYTQQGIYSVSFGIQTPPANVPTNAYGWGALFVYRYQLPKNTEQQYLVQEYVTHSGSGDRYYRIKHSTTSTWQGWHKVETSYGAQAKVDNHANLNNNPHHVTKAQVGLGNVNNLKQATKIEFDSHNEDNTRHITATERNSWNAKSNLALGETSSTAYRGDRGKVAYDHSQTAHAPVNAQKNSDITKVEIEAKLIGDITSHTHSQYVTTDQLGNAGYGDMTKSIYDTDGDGMVDAAESVPWTGVTGKPSNYPPSTHNHDSLYMKIGPVTWNDLKGV
jgi:hypothetical protein